MPKFLIVTSRTYFKTVEYETEAKDQDEANENYNKFENLKEVSDSSLDFLEDQLLEIEEIKEDVHETL